MWAKIQRAEGVLRGGFGVEGSFQPCQAGSCPICLCSQPGLDVSCGERHPGPQSTRLCLLAVSLLLSLSCFLCHSILLISVFKKFISFMYRSQRIIPMAPQHPTSALMSTHRCMHARTHPHTCTHTSTFTHIHTHACVHTCTHASTHMHAYSGICMEALNKN